ncbi:hypothetical protein BROC_00656 [Candidatus Brocadiaceae bacterium]|nr:hypothetical protein BROC_00656 [Candidatus Brocadiaceae bacterium]
MNNFQVFVTRVVEKIAYELSCFLVETASEGIIISGPFAGMSYPRSRLVSYCPKALGTYELELAEIIELLCSFRFELIVNVGAAEGYYAVGMALRNSQARVIAFEANSVVQKQLRKTIQANNLASRIDVRGWCDSESLSHSLVPGNCCLVIMDIEGAENTLLDPVTVPYLQHAYILVEIHDFVSKEIGASLLRRFEKSHKVIEIESRPRTKQDFLNSIVNRRISMIIPEYLISTSMKEGRPEIMRWFYFEPLSY